MSVCWSGWSCSAASTSGDRRLPNWLTIPGAVVDPRRGSCGAGAGRPRCIGAAALFVVYLAVHLVAPAAMGAGDVKLAIGIGALTGAFGVDVWMLAALGAPLLTAVWAVCRRRAASASTVPHGPSMCVAAVAACALAVL